MSALDDRETHSSPAGGRWRQSDRDYFHRRSGETCDLLPKRDHRAFGKLHQRRIQRLKELREELRRKSEEEGEEEDLPEAAADAPPEEADDEESDGSDDDDDDGWNTGFR